MPHRVQQLIESLHRDGSCPLLQIDLTREGVDCPDFVRAQWGERLTIHLDPSYPLNLDFTATGVAVDLSFGGYVTRCTFPYAAIYLVADRATGEGAFFGDNAPASVRRERGLSPAPTGAGGPQFEPRERGAGESRRRRRPRGDQEAPAPAAAAEPSRLAAAEPPRLAALVAVEPEPDAAPGERPAAETDLPQKTDDAAARRRAIFKVIDGGG